MPNPEGTNQLQRQPKYGDIKKLTQLKKSAPMSGAPTPGANAPQRAQRQAIRGQRSQAGAAPAAPAPPTQTPYPTQVALVYQELLADNPDDPLLNYYADLAARNAAGS